MQQSHMHCFLSNRQTTLKNKAYHKTIYLTLETNMNLPIENDNMIYTASVDSDISVYPSNLIILQRLLTQYMEFKFLWVNIVDSDQTAHMSLGYESIEPVANTLIVFQ